MTSRIQDFTPALAPELLLGFNFFELYPFDGGGSFINRAILGSVDDAEITDAIMNRGALDPFGPLEEIDFLRFDRWSTIEQSCWINRMYFIVPLARQAARTGNRAVAEYVRRVILRFGSVYPPPRGKEAVRELNRSVMEARDRDYNTAGTGFDGPICYQWFDFQPASRIIHILHAVWFLRDMDVFDDADYATLDRMLAEHGRVIFEANDVGAKPKRGNHEALRALALLACGILFKGDPQAEHWLDEGLRYCEAHILCDFLEDGHRPEPVVSLLRDMDLPRCRHLCKPLRASVLRNGAETPEPRICDLPTFPPPQWADSRHQRRLSAGHGYLLQNAAACPE